MAVPQPWSFSGGYRNRAPSPTLINPRWACCTSRTLTFAVLSHWTWRIVSVAKADWYPVSQLIGTWPASLTHSLFWAGAMCCLPGREWWLVYYSIRFEEQEKMVITSSDKNWDSPGVSQGVNRRTEEDQGNFPWRFTHRRKIVHVLMHFFPGMFKGHFVDIFSKSPA